MPEQRGALPRRARLFYECMRRLSEDPLAAPAALGRPVADGLGLEGLVARIAPLFAYEPSLTRWVALRGALTQLYISTVDAESRSVPFYPAVETAMGVGRVGTSPNDPTIDVGPDWRTQLSEQQQKDAIGLFCAVGVRVQDYGRYSTLRIDDLRADRCWLGDAVALDVIAWSAVALLRLELVDLAGTPEPDALGGAGWYCEPLWAKAERYWDGSDWTTRCRVADGRSYVEVHQPLV